MTKTNRFLQKRFLTIDDSATMRMLLVNRLSREGALVEEAGDGTTALQMIGAGSAYDLILIDLLLPDTSGIELLEKIRAKNDDATIMVLTGVGGVKSAMVAGQIGADGYFEKQDLSGSDFADFVFAIQRAFEHRAGVLAQRQLAQLKVDFYSMMAHDLRNPLSALLMGFEMIFETAETLTNEQREMLELQQQTMQKLLLWVDDYLEFAQIDAGYLKIEPNQTDLKALVQDSTRLARLQTAARHQDMILELPPAPLCALVDSKKIQQVVENLISNAIKYTPEGGRITIRLSETNGWVELQVHDNGKGIPPAEIPALFAKYHRIPGETKQSIKGMGLGLLIVKEIVQAHNGEVTAESAGIDKGTTFTVRLPLKT